MATDLKLGIIGLSEGNGHPYSWAAICNGYNHAEMASCPFPVIPEYLAKQKWPEDRLPDVRVSHIWTQSRDVSEDIARASLIEKVVDAPKEMIGKIDGLLLARDDAERHYEMSKPFLEAGLPVFIDKPFALSVNEANKMLELRSTEWQVFTCSSLRYAAELKLTKDEKEKLGDIIWVEASIPKKWDTYAIHLLEPIVAQTPFRGKFKGVKHITTKGIRHSMVEWENLAAYIRVTGDHVLPVSIKFYGADSIIEKRFTDAFNCFRASIKTFLDQIRLQELHIPLEETLELVSIIESGR